MFVYENYVDVENLDNHIGGSQGLVLTQSWENALMSALEKEAALSQIREVYHTLVKVNEGYYKEKVNRQDFHLTSRNIAQLLSVPDDGDETYFDNVQLEHLLIEFVSQEELVDTFVTIGTTLTNTMKAQNLTKMTLVFWQVTRTNILLQVGDHSEPSSYSIFTLWRILFGRKINFPSLILNHMWRCRNQKRACIPSMDDSSRLFSSELH